MLEVEKLYVCEQHHLMLYPDPETAAAAARTHQPSSAATNSGNPATYAAFWSNHLRKPVFYTEKNIPFLVLNDKKRYIKVLVGDKKGWIIYADWLELKEFC